jgi:hypothetical protein
VSTVEVPSKQVTLLLILIMFPDAPSAHGFPLNGWYVTMVAIPDDTVMVLMNENSVCEVEQLVFTTWAAQLNADPVTLISVICALPRSGSNSANDSMPPSRKLTGKTFAIVISFSRSSKRASKIRGYRKHSLFSHEYACLEISFKALGPTAIPLSTLRWRDH